jgi:hypothetical protein
MIVDETDDYGFFIDIDFDFDKIHNPIINNNKKHDDVIISENPIKTQYIIIVNFCCFCIFIVVYIYVSPPFK